MKWWKELVESIHNTFYPEKKIKEKLIKVENEIKKGELKLAKFDDAPIIKAKPKRARGVKGKYKADDKATPNINEAWVGGKAPKKKKGTKKKKK
jgi:hypothetical protein|tara:strand:- start:131 stop:412 length:282 start_codon:yes stop_codon:yes gene_type:complete